MGKRSACRIVTDAILGNEARAVSVAGKAYVITPPTIHRLAGAAHALERVGEARTLRELIVGTDFMAAAEALSWFIDDGPGLTDELSRGTPEEVVKGLEAAYEMLDTRPFLRLSALRRSVTRLAANPRL